MKLLKINTPNRKFNFPLQNNGRSPDAAEENVWKAKWVKTCIVFALSGVK